MIGDALNDLARSSLSYATGTAATVTLGDGLHVSRVLWFVGVAAGTLTITPNGGTAGDAIPLPAGSGWGGLSFLPGELGPGTVLLFSGTTSFTVFKARL